MALPNLAGLSLGPPTGPMAVYGIPTYPGDEDDDRETNPSASKQRRGAAGQSLPGLVVYKPEEDNPKDPFTQQPFIPGQWVYKTPTNVPGQPHYNTPTNYDPWMLEQYWAHQEPTWRPWPEDGPLQKYVKDPLGALIPYAEYEALAQWVNDPNNKKPESPPASPFNAAQYVHQPPMVQPPQPPVDPMEGMLAAEPDLHPSTWRNLRYQPFQELVLVLTGRQDLQEFRMGNLLANWLSTLRSYYNWQGHLPAGQFSDLRWSSGFKNGEFDIGWTIDHLIPSAGAERTAPGMVNEGHLVRSNHIVVTFRPWDLPAAYFADFGEVRNAMIGALRDGLNPTRAVRNEELANLIPAISHTEFYVSVNVMPSNAGGNQYSVRMEISPRLLAAFMGLGGIGRANVDYPTTAELVANHYGVPTGERSFVPYPPDWATGEPDPRVGPGALRASEATWNSIVTRITSMLHNFMIRMSAHQYASDGDPASTRTLFLASPVTRAIVRGHERNLLPTYPEAALAQFLSTVHAAETWYETTPGPRGSGLVRHIRAKELSVPFWVAEDIARVPSQ